MLAGVLALAYLIGAIPFSVLVGKRLSGVDVRATGSGNPGTMNTLRSAGLLSGVLVALLDGGKAALAVGIGRWLLGPEAGALAGCAAVVGHCFSPYLAGSAHASLQGGWKTVLRRTGGKGLASGIGMLLVVAWPVAIFAVAVYGLTKLVLRSDATWPSVIGVLIAAPAMWLWTNNFTIGVSALVVAVVVTVKHLPDMRQGFSVEAKG